MDGWMDDNQAKSYFYKQNHLYCQKKKKKHPEIGSSIPITLHKTRGLENRWIIIGQNYLNFYKQAQLFYYYLIIPIEMYFPMKLHLYIVLLKRLKIA